MTDRKYQNKEEQRLAALDASGLLDSPAEPEFDRLTELTSKALRVPVALISLVDRNRQFFKSQCGLPDPVATVRQTPLSHSFCKHVASSGQSLIVSDARINDLVRENLAVLELGVVAYAGVPIVDVDGFVLGSLCAIDTKPRDWPEQDVELLRVISEQVSKEIELRKQTLRLADDLERHRALDAERRVMARLNVHDLRTPLSALMLGMTVLRHAGELNDEQNQYLELCERNSQALMATINTLLDMMNVEKQGSAALRCCEARPRELIDAAIEQVRPLAIEKRIGLAIPPISGQRAVRVDVDKFARVLVNLLGNAIKFTAEGGHVRIGSDEITADSQPFVQFSVNDTGIGIVNSEKIFDEGIFLDQHAPTNRSTGLGLTFCKRVVEAHGGRIWVESTVGQGSTFHVIVPACSERDEKV